MDDGWKLVEVEPMAVRANGNGHHDANGIGPTVELVLDTGHTINGKGNGHKDEAPEPQQTLFSWAEFMAEAPEKSKSYSRKAQPSTTSLFEWAYSVEWEREKELLGAGCRTTMPKGGSRRRCCLAPLCLSGCADGSCRLLTNTPFFTTMVSNASSR